MKALLALLLLASAAGAGLSPLPLLLLSLGLLASGMTRWSRSAPAMTQQGEEVVATIYERRGRLVLRRRTVKEN